MTDLTATALSLRQAAARRPDLAHHLSRALSWLWLHWRRREIIQSLRQVDDRLLRDVGIERADIDQVVDNLIARRG